MILGSCPYDGCDEPLMIALPDAPLPVFAQHECEGCHRMIWTKFSRVDPCSWTEEGFAEDFEVDERTMQIKDRAANSAGMEQT
jgi:hypothetical protein